MSSIHQELVDANHILYNEGILDAFGHVSVRGADRSDRFYMSRSLAPGLVTTEDVLEFDLDGTPIDAAGRRVYLERFIHAAVFKARPDVAAVVHSHTPAVLPFSVARNATLRPVCHMSGFLGLGAPLFDIRDSAGNATDLLVRDLDLGAALARALGTSEVVLMRGHGLTVVGRSLRQVVFRAIYTELNARIQQEAMRLGQVEYLTLDEAAAASATNDAQLDRPWELWKEKARLAHAIA